MQPSFQTASHFRPLRFALLAAFPLLALGCIGDGNDQDSSCVGKCDDLGSRPALEPLELGNFANCRLVLDTSTNNPSAQTDRVLCKLPQLVDNDFVEIETVYADVTTSQVRSPHSHVIEGNDLDGPEIEIGTISGNAYPATARLTFNMSTYSKGGSIDHPSTSDLNRFFGAQMAFELRPDADQNFSVPAPFDLWPVSLWPSEELEAAVPDIFQYRLNYNVLTESDDLNVAVSSGALPLTEIRYRRDQLAVHSDSLISLTNQVFYVPVLKGATASPMPLEVFVHFPNGSAVETALDGPGYYVIAPDGSARRTDPADLPKFGGTAMPDAGTAAPDADTDTQVPDAATDPCGGTCGASDVCVDATCVNRAGQTQSLNCYTPSNICDAGEDSDCAADHACVEGLCRRLTCQTQALNCYPPSNVCEADDSDCAAGHACVEGLCRRLTCQTQSLNCYTPSNVCDAGEDSDCAADHACVEGLCRRLTCQTQSLNCYTPSNVCEADDSDCAAGHVCAAGLCRRLTCQTQSSNCYTPSNVCDAGENTDCAADHVCTAGVCQRETCNN